MPAAQVIFHRLAAREFRAARDWYAARSPDVAERFRMAVDRAVDRIEANAGALPVFVRAYRWVRISRFPYVLIFQLHSPGVVMIVAVAHTSRRPGYWRRRK
jgi:plasmid stabilization system protein ParE